jgi:zinc resistance-associated protein
MKRWMIGLGAAGALALGAFAQSSFAQDRGPDRDGAGEFSHGMRARMSPEDRAAFTDARIAALHAGLKLNADQEKLWPPVEAAIRDLAKQRQEARQARRERFMALRDQTDRDVPGMLRFMADRQAASAEALRKLADASAPLYAALDEGQKRRMTKLGRGFMRMGDGRHMGGMHRHGMGERWRRGALDEGGRDFAWDARRAQ